MCVLQGANAIRVLLIAAIAVAAGLVVYMMPMRLGLDLQGGVQVVLEGQETGGTPVNAETIEQTMRVIERRIDALGVTEPVVQRQGNQRIIVELPGISDTQAAIDTIGKTALLEFQNPFGETVMTGAHLQNVQLTQDQFGRWAIGFKLDREGTAIFRELTQRYFGQTISIVLDGEVLMAPVVNAVIDNGEGIIEGAFTSQEAQNYVILLRSGALPVPLEVAHTRQVGPTLGEESIQGGIRAGVAGTIAVFLFMLAYYRLPGLAANLALAIYIVTLLAAFILLRATLTLPGIAGLVLSIGMAVDANVIIFERIKEELRSGKRLRISIQDGWKHAFSAILDSNITTLITAGVLFWLGTGPVRGFAVMLSLGIVISMFTALFVTRVILTSIVDLNPDRFVHYFGVKGAVAR